MQRLSRAEFEAARADYDFAVAADPAIDRFCSLGAWVLSFHDAFLPRAELRLAREGGAFVALAAAEEPTVGVVLQPLESMWGFASPLVGDDASCELLGRLLEPGCAAPAREPLLLSGVSLERARLEPLLRLLSPHYALRPLAETLRWQASLDGGVDGWLARRSRQFRRGLREARRRTRDAGVRFESVSPGVADAVAAAYERALAVEHDTWKTRSGNGVDRGPMREFYARMLPCLAARGALRMLFATRDGVDVGYLYGGIAGGLFRGLQFGFRESERRLGLGNALQAEMIERLCVEGLSVYDLGSQSDYKRRWAEPGLVTLRLLARPRA
jgi:CelD/BcsL family acetyltransferase involved in cellulose biosynthesis